MKITLIAVGKRMPKWVNAGYEEYAKRMPMECHLQLIEIQNYKRTTTSHLNKLIEQEGQQILAAVPKQNYVIAFERTGKSIDTQLFSQYLERWHNDHQDVSFLIGGPEGLAKTCCDSAREIWSLSKLTFPHPLVRVIVAEQIYRSWSILKRHPYNRSDNHENSYQ